MAVEVRATPLANKIIEELPRRARRAFDQFEADLAARGCAALAYRLSGDLLDHLCVVHLIGALRVIVAFESAEVAYVILVGNHDDSRPPLDVYRQLYAAAGHEPLGQAGRDKPPCCDTETGEPPVDPGLLDELLAHMRRFRASDVRSAPGRRHGPDNVILADRGIAEPHKPGQVSVARKHPLGRDELRPSRRASPARIARLSRVQEPEKRRDG